MELERAAQQLAALGNQTRLAVYRILIQAGPAGSSVGDIRDQLEVPASTLSHHIARLIHAGLIMQERESRTLYCKANFKNMDALMTFLVDNCCDGNSCIQINT
jgi:DNA-binding transcriptional ArsR family regulator